MNLTPEQQHELAAFPPPLRTLVEAELAAGNTIVEIGHSFPAPPAGAYFKLARKVTTRPRTSVDGLDFYDRNTSLHSGEFTDTRRFHFVLEPPNPPPPEPDMDAIRQAMHPKPGPRDRVAHRPAELDGTSGPGPDASPASTRPAQRRPRRLHKPAPAVTPAPGPPPGGWTSTAGDGWVVHHLRFRDPRPPHEVQFLLERALMVLFTGGMEDQRLVLRAKARVNGAHYSFDLRFESASRSDNGYLLHALGSWVDQPADSHDYFRKTSESWFGRWTRDWAAAGPETERKPSPRRYQRLCEQALQAEADLDSVPAIQKAVLEGLRGGARFGTAHKEGGTRIVWRDGQFLRSDYGDDPKEMRFTDPAEFLDMLRRSWDMEVTRHAEPTPPSELDAWRLILRRLDPGHP